MVKALLSVDPHALIKTDPQTRVALIDSTHNAQTLLAVLDETGCAGGHLPEATSI